jgi:hypothetical protein
MHRNFYVKPALLVGTAAVIVALGISTAYVWAVASHSTAAGAQWRQSSLRGVLVHSLALGHTHPSLAFAGTSKGVYRRERGQRWDLVFHSGDVWDVALLPDDRTVIVADNDGNVDLSRDAGNHWQRIPVASEGIFAVTAQPGDGGHMLAGGSGGVYRSTDGGLRWKRRLTLPGSAGAAFAWQPGSKSTIFAGAVAGQAGGSTEVYISRDAGQTWQVFGREVQGGGGIMSLALASNHRLLAGTMGHATWSVVGSGGIWQRTAAGMPDGEVHVAAIVTVPGKQPAIFAGTLGFGVYRSVDGGRHWSALSNGLPASRNATIVLSLVYDHRTRTLYAGTGDGIYSLTPR